MQVLRRCRVTHNNDVFCSGRSWLVSHYPPSCGWHLSGQSGADGLCLSSWTCAMLLLFFSNGALSAALISHWSKLPLKFPSMKWYLVLWISVSLAYHHLPIIMSYRVCCFIAAEGSQQNFHCKLFYFILLGFYSSLGETVFCKKTEYWLQMRADTQFDGKSGVDSEVKIGAGSA